jgi:hypothetical protein
MGDEGIAGILSFIGVKVNTTQILCKFPLLLLDCAILLIGREMTRIKVMKMSSFYNGEFAKGLLEKRK